MNSFICSGKYKNIYAVLIGLPSNCCGNSNNECLTVHVEANRKSVIFNRLNNNYK